MLQRYRHLIILALLGLASCANWSTSDTARQLAITGLIAVDLQQTLDASNRPDIVEANPFYSSEHPESSEVYLWHATGALLAYAISLALPAKYRKYFQTIVLIGEGGNVVGNHFLGKRKDEDQK